MAENTARLPAPDSNVSQLVAATLSAVTSGFRDGSSNKANAKTLSGQSVAAFIRAIGAMAFARAEGGFPSDFRQQCASASGLKPGSFRQYWLIGDDEGLGRPDIRPSWFHEGDLDASVTAIAEAYPKLATLRALRWPSEPMTDVERIAGMIEDLDSDEKRDLGATLGERFPRYFAAA